MSGWQERRWGRLGSNGLGRPDEPKGKPPWAGKGGGGRRGRGRGGGGNGNGGNGFSLLTASGTTSLTGEASTEIAFGTESRAGAFRGAGAPTNGFIIPAGVTHVNVGWALGVTTSFSEMWEHNLRKNGSSTVGRLRDRSNTSYPPERDIGFIGYLPVSEGDTLTMEVFLTGANELANNGDGTYYFFIEAAEIT